MIVSGEIKAEQLYLGDTRAYMVFLGEDLIYNCYAIPQQEIVWLNSDGYVDLKANTEWKLN